MSPDSIDPQAIDELRTDLWSILSEAGEIALGFARGGAKRWTKGDHSVVTEADLKVDRFLQERLPPLVSGSGWLSEETADTPERLGRDTVWIVDPIDGTRSFVEGQPTWVISVALVHKGRPVWGAVYNPSTGERFEGRKGAGAWLDGRLIEARAPGGSLKGAEVVGPRPLVDTLRPLGIAQAPWVYALAYRICFAAAGRVDAAVASRRAKDWDIAAADLIVSEAGAALLTIDGERPLYNQPTPVHPPLVAAREPLNAALRDAMTDAARAHPGWA